MELPSVAGYMSVARTIPGVDTDAVEAALLFQRTADTYLAALEEHFVRYGLSDGKFSLLMNYLMHTTPDVPLTLSDLASQCGVSRANITGLVDGLAQAGLVVRVPHPDDRRMLTIHLTPKGRDLMDTLIPAHFRRLASLMAMLSGEEQQQFVTLLGKLHHGIRTLPTS